MKRTNQPSAHITVIHKASKRAKKCDSFSTLQRHLEKQGSKQWAETVVQLLQSGQNLETHKFKYKLKQA